LQDALHRHTSLSGMSIILSVEGPSFTMRFA
jgi:hypothetical protein